MGEPIIRSARPFVQTTANVSLLTAIGFTQAADECGRPTDPTHPAHLSYPAYRCSVSLPLTGVPHTLPV
jgi:hypothetical protein